jgi:hypothetical protein
MLFETGGVFDYIIVNAGLLGVDLTAERLVLDQRFSAVLFTASGAAFRGMNVVIPVDGMSSVDAIAEYATVIDFQTAPQVSARTTLTRSDMIKF